MKKSTKLIVRRYTWQLYDSPQRTHKGVQHRWRWTRLAPNGKVVGASTEDYRNRGKAAENAIIHGGPWQLLEGLNRVKTVSTIDRELKIIKTEVIREPL